ncbi:hypothetical protein OF83DRAFT_1177779 [Amylostereum chailletii]|nr:hypothetical protein OF83DRAFT_1177779 [Amylostereum chailletii]
MTSTMQYFDPQDPVWNDDPYRRSSHGYPSHNFASSAPSNYSNPHWSAQQQPAYAYDAISDPGSQAYEAELQNMYLNSSFGPMAPDPDSSVSVYEPTYASANNYASSLPSNDGYFPSDPFYGASQAYPAAFQTSPVDTSSASSMSCPTPDPPMHPGLAPTIAPQSPPFDDVPGFFPIQAQLGHGGPDPASPNSLHKASTGANVRPRPPGACARCKRLKMKCIFPEGAMDCARCATGRHECVVEGRKPRTPGQREQLLRQIRAKNEAINEHLESLEHSALTTPLSLVPSLLPLSAREREIYREVLTWLEKRPAPQRTVERSYALIDTSELEDYPSDEDDEDVLMDDPSPPSSAVSVRSSSRRSQFDEAAPLGLFSKASNKFGRASPLSSTMSASGLGIANPLLFKSKGPYSDLNLRRIIVERELVPEILLSGLVSTQEAKILFEIFFEHINPFITLLDENIHNAASVLRRSPFLFTVICAVSSRFYRPRKDLYKMAMHFAKVAAASAVIDGWKCVETVQAYLVLASYPPPTKRKEDDRSWIYTGIAMRIAMELNFNKLPTTQSSDERVEREAFNNQRTWVVCWALDSSTSLEMGVVPSAPEDAIIVNLAEWASSSRFQTESDLGLPGIIGLLRIVRSFSSTVQSSAAAVSNPMQKNNVGRLIDSFDAKLLGSASAIQDVNTPVLLIHMASYLRQYCRLVVFWFGFQVEQKSRSSSARYLLRGMDAAFDLLNTWTRELSGTGHMGYAPDFLYAGAGFAGTFLLKLLHPNFKALTTDEQRKDMVDMVQNTIRTLGSDEIAADEQHAPHQFSVFLDNLLQGTLGLWEQSSEAYIEQ